MSIASEAKNLEAISNAIKQHDAACPSPAIEIRLNPYELDRLGWDTILGLPCKADPKIGTGRFRVICALDKEKEEAMEKAVEAVSPDRDLQTV